ncbi:MAG: hypothetical protein J5710_15050 [Treponema sp.]|nr:hypothetical protein [Treponema sp.]
MSQNEFVRCNCFKNGLSKPFEYIKYVKLIDNYFELDLPEEIKKNNELEYKIDWEFSEWTDFPCEHEMGEYYSCRLGGAFQYFIRLLNDKTRFPTLSTQLPDFNEHNFIPTSFNTQLRKEAKEFMDLKITAYNLSDGWEIGENIDELLCEKGNEKLYSYNNTFRIEKDNKIIFQSSDFTVERIINRRFIFSDKDKKAETTVFWDMNLFEYGNKHRIVYEKNTYNMQDELQFTYDELIKLLDASDTTGNPICWD